MTGELPYTSKWPTVNDTPRIAVVLDNLTDQRAYEASITINECVSNGLNICPVVFYYHQGNGNHLFCPKIHISQIFGYTGVIVHTDEELASRFNFGMSILYSYKKLKNLTNIPLIVRSQYFNQLHNTKYPVMSRLDIPTVMKVVNIG